jgi:hypothetical protein
VIFQTDAGIVRDDVQAITLAVVQHPSDASASLVISHRFCPCCAWAPICTLVLARPSIWVTIGLPARSKGHKRSCARGGIQFSVHCLHSPL